MTNHVLALGVGTTAHATLVNVDVLALVSLDELTDSCNRLEHLLAHLVVSELIVQKLELILSLSQLSILLVCGARKLLLKGLHGCLIDSLVDFHGFLLFL